MKASKTIADVAAEIRATVEPVAKIATSQDWMSAAKRVGFRDTDRDNWLRFGNNVYVLIARHQPGVKLELSEVSLYSMYAPAAIYFDWTHTTPQQLAQICESLELAQASVNTVNDLVSRYTKSSRRRGKVQIQYTGSRR